MKKIEIIIRPEKLEDLKELLNESNITGMMISNVMGHGNQLGHTQQYRGTKYSVNLVSKLKVEIVVKDDVVEELLPKMSKKLSTGHVGDGKVFIYNVENAMRIRTGETGEEAL